MTFYDFIDHKRPLLKDYILSFLKKKKNPDALYFYNDLLERLSIFVPQGKLLRGIFVLLIADLYSQNNIKDDEVLPIAGAMEIVQSAFLIHDDMMDKDRIRRGQPTIFAQYEEEAQKQEIPDAYHYGQSMGLCVGDLAFFLAFELISKTECYPLIQTFVQEIERVSAAQMTDIHYGLSSDEPTLRNIRSMYMHKTAHYSFSLPFCLGAMKTNAPKKDIENLRLLGEYIGIAFQIKDDEIKLLGSADEVGTDIGSDIRENKKTLIRAWLFQKAENKDKQKLKTLFGNKKITHNEIDFVRNCLYKYNIPAAIEHEIQRLTKRADTLIQQLHLSESDKYMLMDVKNYVISRKR